MKRLKKLLFKIKGHLPVRLPVGLTAHEAFTTAIFEAYDFPDLPSYRQAVASMIMQLGTTVDRERISFFVKGIRKAMANQVAYEVIEKIRAEDKAQRLAQIQQPEAAQAVEASHDDQSIQDG